MIGLLCACLYLEIILYVQDDYDNEEMVMLMINRLGDKIKTKKFTLHGAEQRGGRPQVHKGIQSGAAATRILSTLIS